MSTLHKHLVAVSERLTALAGEYSEVLAENAESVTLTINNRDGSKSVHIITGPERREHPGRIMAIEQTRDTWFILLGDLPYKRGTLREVLTHADDVGPVTLWSRDGVRRDYDDMRDARESNGLAR